MLHRGSKYPVVGTFIKAIILSLSSPNTDFWQLSELSVYDQRLKSSQYILYERIVFRNNPTDFTAYWILTFLTAQQTFKLIMTQSLSARGHLFFLRGQTSPSILRIVLLTKVFCTTWHKVKRCTIKLYRLSCRFSQRCFYIEYMIRALWLTEVPQHASSCSRKN